ncbi:MAG: fimbrillin family protein [Alistipes sp.]
MKKRACLMLSVAVSLWLTSCSEHTPTPTPRDGRIEFAAAEWADTQSSERAGVATRGVTTDNTTLLNFGVYAYYAPTTYNATTSVPNFMFNTQVTKTGGAWLYNPIMYWPNSGTVSFFAYAPYVTAGDASLQLSSTPTTPGPPQLTYTVPDVIVNQRDLLIATPLIDQTKTNINAEHKLVIPFRHALSSIVFQAKMSDAVAYPVKVNSVTIGALKNKATYRYNSGVSTPWTIATDAVDKSYALTLQNGGLQDVNVGASTTSFVDISAADAQLILLPQSVTDAGDQVTVSIDLYTAGATSTPITRNVTAKLADLIPQSQLAAGKRYTVKIRVAPQTADATLTCTVAAWASESIIVPPFD